MKRRKIKILVATMCITSVLLSGFAFGGNSTSNKLSLEKGKVFEKGMKNVFQMSDEDIKNHGKNNDQKSAKDKLTYKVNVEKQKDGESDITIKGSVSLNDKKYNFTAEGPLDIVKVNSKTIEMGILDGEIKINGESRIIAVDYDKCDGNEYLVMTINHMESEEGMVVLRSGTPNITEDDVIEMAQISQSEEPTASAKANYDLYDFDFEEVEDESKYGIKSWLYVEEDILEGYDGTMCSVSESSKDNVESLFEDDYNIDEVTVKRLTVIVESYHEESELLTHSPAEEDSDSQVKSFIQNVLGDLGIVPWSISDILFGLGNDIDVYYENDNYYRKWKIYPDNDEIFEEGGYPVTISINKDRVNDHDRITFKSDIKYRVYYWNSSAGCFDYFSVYTDNTYNRIDLSNYN